MGEKVVGLILNKEFKNNQGNYQSAKFIATGTLIQPQVVLTAAHCLKDTLSVSVTSEEKIPDNGQSGFVNSRKFITHPNYENTNHRLDFGLVFLPHAIETLSEPNRFPELKSFSPEISHHYIRYGYGERGKENRRFRAEMNYSLENKDGFVLSEDATGVYGDSGGPVFVEQDSSFVLIGIHTGREKDSESRELKNRSFMTPFTPAIIIWINKMINDYRLKLAYFLINKSNFRKSLRAMQQS